MYKNYIKIALRNLLKNKVFSVANIIGLTLAFGISILLVMTAMFELSFDQFHQKKDSIYQIYLSNQTSKGTRINTVNPIPLAPSLKNEVGGIKHITRSLSQGELITYEGKDFDIDSEYVDPDFFEIFSYPSIAGNIENPLPDKNSVALTESTAKKLFGATDPVGKTILLNRGNEEKPFTVSAILKDIPTNSSVDFEILIPFENHPEYAPNIDGWESYNHQVYLELEEGVNVAQFEENTRNFTNLHYKSSIDDAIRDGAQADEHGQFKQFYLLPYKDVAFVSYTGGVAKVSRSFPYMILGIALLIIFIASANFINMNIALSERRLKEVGMRKTLGAFKRQLFVQFWSESLLVFVVSIILGLVMANLLLDPFKTLFDTQATFDNIVQPRILIGFGISLLVITFIAGGYPALLVSKLTTLRALKGKWELGKNRLRNALIIVQFVIAIVLISGTLVLHSQIQFMRNKDLGYNKEQVISIPLNGKKNGYRVVDLLREELIGNPNVLAVSGADINLGRGRDGSVSRSKWGFDYKERFVGTNILTVDHGYLKTLDIDLLSGRTFSEEHNETSSLIINEAMAKELGEQDPLSVQIHDDSVTYTVVGVIKDYHFQKLNKEIEPLTLFNNNEWDLYYAYVKIAPNAIAESYDTVKAAWEKIEPQAEFLGSFLDENFDRTFRREKKMATMVTSASVLGIILSCIGLFAMSILVVSQRTKEIGIRKVVGASVSSVAVLLTKDFLKLVGFAFIIAAPIAWYILDGWLQSYAFRIKLSPIILLTAGLFAAIIAFVAVGSRTMKAASANPIKSLRTE